MALTRDFKETIQARLACDPAFRDALFIEALNAYLSGDIETGKAILRDLVNATVGFEQLAVAMQKPSKSLHRMLTPKGNPTTENFFAMLRVLQQKTGVKVEVNAIHAAE